MKKLVILLGVSLFVWWLAVLQIGSQRATSTPPPSPAVLQPTPAPTIPPPAPEPTTTLSYTEICSELSKLGPELILEIERLPEIRDGISDEDLEALNDIYYLYVANPEAKKAFHLMMDEGIKTARKYCTPLQALFWLAYDKDFDKYNPLEVYSLRELLNKSWRNTTISDNYKSEKWQNFEELVDRLNSPELISIYTNANIEYQSETINEYVPARLVFDRKVDDCDGFATFQAYLLKANGYEAWNVGMNIRSPLGHNVCGYVIGGSYWALDVGGKMKGPYGSLEQLADSHIPGALIVLFNPFDITSPSKGSVFSLPHTIYRQ